MASQCASNAPTGIGNAGAQAEPLGPFGARVCRRSGRRLRSVPPSLCADAGEQRDRREVRNSSGGRPPSGSFHIHLWPMAQMLRGTCGGIGDAAQDGRRHVAMFQRGGEAVALLGIVAQPVQQLGEAPFGGVDAAAPVDGFEPGGARGGGDLRGLAPGAVVAPEVVVVERLEVGVHRE